MIAENHYLIPDESKASYAESGKYLLVVTDLESTELEQIDPIIEKITLMRDMLDTEIKDLKKNYTDIISKQEELKENSKN